MRLSHPDWRAEFKGRREGDRFILEEFKTYKEWVRLEPPIDSGYTFNELLESGCIFS